MSCLLLFFTQQRTYFVLQGHSKWLCPVHTHNHQASLLLQQVLRHGGIVPPVVLSDQDMQAPQALPMQLCYSLGYMPVQTSITSPCSWTL